MCLRVYACVCVRDVSQPAGQGILEENGKVEENERLRGEDVFPAKTKALVPVGSLTPP